MINIELTHLNCDNVLTETTNAIENICDTYALQNHLGTLSLAITEMCRQIFNCTQDPDAEIDMTICLESKQVRAEIHTDINIDSLKNELAQKDAANNDIFTLTKLCDTIDCEEDIKMGFSVQPNFNIQRQMGHSTQTVHTHSAHLNY
ncbi:MAG: hypothetical protein MJZ76_03110 [Bacteroidales bacterium]|nr:hypothetical protein [Bacteroidales bacterium]